LDLAAALIIGFRLSLLMTSHYGILYAEY